MIDYLRNFGLLSFAGQFEGDFEETRSLARIGILANDEALKRLDLANENFSILLARIHSPIGIDIGGKSSAEVALSIIAEVVAVRSGKRA